MKFDAYGLNRKYSATSYPNQALSREKRLVFCRKQFAAHSTCDSLEIDFTNSDNISFDYSPNFSGNLQTSIYADMTSSSSQVISNLAPSSPSFTSLSENLE